MWGVSGLSSQPSLMPPHPGWSLDGITGNWIVFHLLWKQPESDTPSPPGPVPALFPQYLHFSATATPAPPILLTGEPMFPSHYGGMSHWAPCFYMSSKVSPCDAETLGWMSAECSIKQLLAQSQQRQERPSAVWRITLIGWSNMLRGSTDMDCSISTIAVLPNLCCTNLSFGSYRSCKKKKIDEEERRQSKDEDNNGHFSLVFEDNKWRKIKWLVQNWSEENRYKQINLKERPR